MKLVTIISSVALISALSYQTAHADALSDAMLDATGQPYTKEIIEKLVVIKAGAKCLAKLGDKDGGARHSGSFITRDIEKYAKRVTGESWDDIESQDKTKNAAMVAEKIAAFRSKFSYTIDIEGDDCDNGSSALWLSYWFATSRAINQYPIDVPKLNITIKVRKAARAVTYTMSPDGTTVEYTAPRDIEPKNWAELMERPFRQRASGFADDYVFALSTSSDFVAATVLDKLVTLKVGPACRAKLPDPNAGAVHAASFFTRDIADYAKGVTGDDWTAISNQSSGTRESNRAMVAEMVAAFRKRFALTITVDGPDCDATMNALWLRYTTTIVTALRDRPPTAKAVMLDLKVTKGAKDIKVTASKDGGKISIVAPLAVEPAAWTDKLQKPFEKFPRK